MTHPDAWDPGCGRCRTVRARILLLAPDAHRPPQPDLNDAILAHWNDPGIPMEQLDRWDSLAPVYTAT